MATYIILANFTDKGVHDAKDTISRGDKFKAMATNAGVTVKDIYWTIGTFDSVAICEAPDDETATALALSVSTRGNVRTQTLRAFSSEEMGRILNKMV